MKSITWYKHDNDKITLTIYVQPGAKQSGIAGLHGDALKVRLASLPVEGQANKALLKYIATLFDVPLRQVTLKQGNKSRLKTVIIKGSTVSPEQLY